jgi:hypothetical protein
MRQNSNSVRSVVAHLTFMQEYKIVIFYCHSHFVWFNICHSISVQEWQSLLQILGCDLYSERMQEISSIKMLYLYQTIQNHIPEKHGIHITITRTADLTYSTLMF